MAITPKNPKVPGSWYSRYPSRKELYEFLRQGKGTERVNLLGEAATYFTHRTWEEVPKKVSKLTLSGGGLFERNSEGADAAIMQIVKSVWLNGQWRDQAYLLASRLGRTEFQFSQCIKKGHTLTASITDGAYPAGEVPSVVISSLTGMSFYPQFSTQLLLCDDHSRSSCVTCLQEYSLLELAPKFLSSKTDECGTCLSHSLMYVEAKHSPNIYIKGANGKRQLYRKTDWGITPVAIPVGPPPPQEATIVYGTNLMGDTAVPWMPLLISDPNPDPDGPQDWDPLDDGDN